MKQKYLLIFSLILLFTSVYPQSPKEGIRGLFFSISVGPRFPITKFNQEQSTGIGFSTELSYSNLNVLPIFFNFVVSYQNHQGDFNLYKNSDHSSLSTNLINLGFGARYFMSPIMENFILLMPILEGGITYSFINKFHQYKIYANKDDFNENYSNFGAQFGAGFSIFLMDLVGTYNFIKNHQYLAIDLRLRIPIAIKL